MKPCNCISGNVPRLGGSVEALVLTVPEGLSEAGRRVCVDSCIEGAVTLLWAAGISTRSNCCGHNGKFPRHILVFIEDKDRAREALDAAGWHDIPVFYWDGDTRKDLISGRAA